ncbi:fimbrial protein [Klebsiella aerogenes]|uniref:fimbrial protein n=1 Tax=Klebsiella aerogenes TaxID=548 RepID=UPI0034D25B14
MREGRCRGACALLTLSLALSVSLPALAGNKHFVTIYGGDVHFYGQVVSAACAVSADSVDQTVQMGQVRSNDFKDLGDWEDPVHFQIKLEDCDTNVSQTAGVLFTGQSDGKDPQVFKAGYGAGAAQGVGIGIFDESGNLLVPDTAPPWYAPLQDGENILHFMARYRSTSRRVQAGDAGTQVWFNVVYQ